MSESSKRHSKLLSLICIPNCLSKTSVIGILKRDNQLKCDGAIEFLRLCQNFGLTPTFAKIDETKSKKWNEWHEVDVIMPLALSLVEATLLKLPKTFISSSNRL